MKPIWIGTLNKNDANNSLPPELFRKTLSIRSGLAEAKLAVSAMGIYKAKSTEKTFRTYGLPRDILTMKAMFKATNMISSACSDPAKILLI